MTKENVNEIKERLIIFYSIHKLPVLQILLSYTFVGKGFPFALFPSMCDRAIWS